MVFAVDRAGIVGADGETHQGIYDISYFTHMPNMTVMMPKNGIELEKMLRYAVYNIDGPVAVRYPRGNISDIYSENTSEIEFGKAELLEDGEKIAVISAGAVCDNAAKVCEMLKNDGYNPMLINMRFAKPVDKEMLKLAAKKCGYIFTLEDNVIDGGAGMAVLEALNDMELMNDVKVHSYAFPDKFIEHGTRDQLFERYKLDSESIYKDIKERIDINGR